MALSPLAQRIEELTRTAREAKLRPDLAVFGAARDVRLRDLDRDMRAAFARYEAERCQHAACYDGEGWSGCLVSPEAEE